eukprot:3935976-Rhodomonas_salina.3
MASARGAAERKENSREEELLLEHMLTNAEHLAMAENVDIGACIGRVGGIHRDKMSKLLKMQLLHEILKSTEFVSMGKRKKEEVEESASEKEQEKWGLHRLRTQVLSVPTSKGEQTVMRKLEKTGSQCVVVERA